MAVKAIDAVPTPQRQISDVVEEQLREVSRTYNGFVIAQTKLKNQQFAIVKRLACPGGSSAENPPAKDLKAAKDQIEAEGNLLYDELSVAHATLDPGRNELKKILTKMGATLPFVDFVRTEMKGFGTATYAQLIAETGDLTRYANPAKLWKRMGLGLVGNQIQKRVKDKELAIAMGYNPRRRSLMYVAEENMIKLNTGRYRKVYDEYKAKQVKKHPEMTKGHVHNRAMRYMIKRVLLDLWKLWNGQKVNV